jgi:HEAT repeat protein
MKKLLLAAALLALGSLLFQDISSGHGGTYRGPGDTTPAGSGGAGGGGPGSGTPGPAGPTGPGGPGAASTGGAGPGTQGGPGGAAAQTGGSEAPDLSQWTFWWEFNKDAYLNLKDSIHSGSVLTGSDDFFLGRGEAEDVGKDTLRPTPTQIRNEIVPALLEALAKEKNNDILTGAMIALAKIGDVKSESGESEFEKVIRSFLKDPVQEVAETAAIALGILANESSADILLALSMDTPEGRTAVGKGEVDYRTRAFATYGLGLLGKQLDAKSELRRRIVSSLFTVLDSDQTRAKDVSVATVIALGLVSLPPEDYMPPVDPDAKGKPAAAPRTSGRGQVEALMALLRDNDRDHLLRAHAPTAVARLAESYGEQHFEDIKALVVPVFIDIADGKIKDRAEVIQSAIFALGTFGDNDQDKLDVEVRKVLLNAPKDQASQLAQNVSRVSLAYVASRKGKGADAAKGIKEAQDHFTAQIARSAGGLQYWNYIGAGVFGRRLAKSDENGKGPEVRSALGTALRQTLVDARSAQEMGPLFIALGILGDQDAKVVVAKRLSEIKEETTRGYACVSLGLLGAREYIKEMTEIVATSKYQADLLKQAAIGLGLLGDKEMVPTLITMLNEAKSLATQASISTALGFIGDTRSVEPLCKLLADKTKTDKARAFAAVALGIVADKESLPWNAKIAADLNYTATTETLNNPTGTGILNIL